MWAQHTVLDSYPIAKETHTATQVNIRSILMLSCHLLLLYVFQVIELLEAILSGFIMALSLRIIYPSGASRCWGTLPVAQLFEAMSYKPEGRSKHSGSVINTRLLIMYKTKVIVCSESHNKTHKCNVISMQIFIMLNLMIRIITGRL
jgi:hypothetical protein